MSKEDIEILKEKIEFWKNDPRIMIQEENYKILQVIENILIEIQADKERIKELEEENKKNSISIICLQEELEDSIPVQKVKELIKDETINISGFECVAVEDLEKLLEDKQ